MEKSPFKIAIIGGGAAGYFAAIHAAQSGHTVVIFEKSNSVLSKVKVSGGGRCNVTHACEHPSQLTSHYPRGGKSLKKGFGKFAVSQTIEWFESRGVPLKTEADGRMFPVTDSSQIIIDLLQKEANQNGVVLNLRHQVQAIVPIKNEGFQIEFRDQPTADFDKVIVCTGGQAREKAYHWLKDLALSIEKPIPSLFTFNVPDSDLKDLQGLSVSHGWVQVPATKWRQEGPVLITHWGFSAPAVIKLSAWQAIDLHDRQYQFPILINWSGKDENSVREELLDFQKQHPKKLVRGSQQFQIPSRLWQRLSEKAEISENQRFLDLPKKQLNKLVELIVRCPYNVNGKTTFKEEFVTCGGVSLNEVDLKTFQSKKHPGLYLAGEVLNVDGVTGGFNFQHAWTSGYLAGSDAANAL